MKGYSLTWWITEIITDVFIACIWIFEIVFRMIPFISNQNYIIQNVAIVVGFAYILWEISKLLSIAKIKVRSYIRKKVVKSTYTQEKINRIKKIMEDSVSHLR